MESMILDAMKEVERLSGLGSDKPVIEHLAYQYDGKVHTYSHRIEPTENGRKLGAAIEPFRPAKLEVSTLTGFIDAIKGGCRIVDRDRAGRDLPVWQGCRRIATGEVFLMNWQVNDSLDGRYFGLTSTDQIIGRAIPLWTDEDGDGRFQWRAPTR